MSAFHNIYRMKKFIHIFIALIIVSTFGISSASEDSPEASSPKLLILDNCDEDNDLETTSFGDQVLLLNNKGELKQLVSRLAIGGSWYGSRDISVSEDGRFFVVCEDELISMYKTATLVQVKNWPNTRMSQTGKSGLLLFRYKTKE